MESRTGKEINKKLAMLEKTKKIAYKGIIQVREKSTEEDKSRMKEELARKGTVMKKKEMEGQHNDSFINIQL